MSLEVMLTYNRNFTVAAVSKVERGNHRGGACWVRIRVNRTSMYHLDLLVWQMQCWKPRATRHKPCLRGQTFYLRLCGARSPRKTDASSLRSLISLRSRCYRGLFWLELQRSGVLITALDLNVLFELHLSVVPLKLDFIKVTIDVLFIIGKLLSG